LLTRLPRLYVGLAIDDMLIDPKSIFDSRISLFSEADRNEILRLRMPGRC
jgi:hypothetical protein